MDKLKIRIETNCQSFGTTNIAVELPIDIALSPADLNAYLNKACAALVSAATEKYSHPTNPAYKRD